MRDDFTKANPVELLGIEGWGWGLVKDPATGVLERTNDPDKIDEISIPFAVRPRYQHDDGLLWFHIGTVRLDIPGELKLKVEDVDGQVAFDAFKVTPHVAKETIEYDYANRPTRSHLYSERLSTERLETQYAYDVAGHLVAVRNYDKAEAEESASNIGYAYDGAQQIFSFDMGAASTDLYKIKNLNFVGIGGEVLAVDTTSAGTPAPESLKLETAWQLNNLDLTRFTDTGSWAVSAYSFAGKQLASTNTDYLVQSRDSARSTWSGQTESAWSAFSSSYSYYVNPANNWNSGTWEGRIFGGVQYAAWTTAALAGSFIGVTQSVAAFGVAGAAAYTASGAALGAANTYVANPDASFIDYAAGMGSGAMNPLGEAASVGGGLVGSAVAYARGGDAAAMRGGYAVGSTIAGVLSGGLDDYGRALGKIAHAAPGLARSAQHAEALQHALRYTGASVGFGLAGSAAGYAIGGTDGALMGASLGSAMANFAVACFTAGTPIVVDLEGNSRPIEELEVGDTVLARSEFDPNGPLELKRVEEKFVRTAAVMELVVRGRSIKTTAEHPFYVPAQGKFVAAGELQAGDELVSHTGELVRIDSVSLVGEITTVYNLRVADHHSYFVGGGLWQFDVWVHNAYVAPRSGLTHGTGMQTLSLRGAWRKANFGNEAEGIVYVLRDSQTGELLKVGKTEVATFAGRFAVYQKAGRRTGRNLELDTITIGRGSGQTMESLESQVRSTLIDQGHRLGWDNTGNRLGKPGPGVPGASVPRRLRDSFRWNYGTETLEPR